MEAIKKKTKKVIKGLNSEAMNEVKEDFKRVWKTQDGEIPFNTMDNNRLVKTYNTVLGRYKVYDDKKSEAYHNKYTLNKKLERAKQELDKIQKEINYQDKQIEIADNSLNTNRTLEEYIIDEINSRGYSVEELIDEVKQ